MPHFENIDQYETANPKSGKKKVIPIAPHSMQAVEYRPVKRAQSGPPPREVDPPFKDVHVEPVSIRQMEKEFKQAARSAPRAQRRKPSGSLLSRVKAFFQSLFGKEKPRHADRRARSSRPPRRTKSGSRGKGKPPEGRGQDADNDSGKPRSQKPRRRRSRPKGPRPEGSGGPQEGKKRDSGPSPKGETGNANARKRPRRNRRRSSGGSSQNRNTGGPDKGSSPKQN